MNSGMWSRAEHAGVLGLLMLLGLPACDSSSSSRPAGDAGDAVGPRAEVTEGGPEIPGARDGTEAEANAADMDASADADGAAGQDDGLDATDANEDEDVAAPDGAPGLAVDLGAMDGPVGVDAVAERDGGGDVALDVTPAVDAGLDVAYVDGLGDVRDAAIGTDARGDVPLDGMHDAEAKDGNRDGAEARDIRGNEAFARDGGGMDGGACCGCLCRDPVWSCSQDTCLDSSGRALGLAAEAGFFELAGGDYTSENQVRTSPTHRIWYSFHPAATAPESKPLAVFFNGGPGSATSAYLFCFNTAPYTLDPAFAGTGEIASNASSWTQLANLLYIDSPATGFSYPLPLADGTKPTVGIDMDRDAAVFVRVIVRFLARHPALQGNRVVLVGESYGGTRAALMLSHLYDYQMLTATDASYQDQDLYDDLVQHFTAVFPGKDATKLPADTIATQFGHQVLIQPVVAGDAQWAIQDPDTSVCVAGFDVYQCDESRGWSDEITKQAATHLAELANLRQALGVEPTTVEWLHARARTKAYGRSGSNAVDAPELTAAFGQLGSDDQYFVMLNNSVLVGYSGARNWHDPSIGTTFLADLAYADTFITNAKLDTVVAASAIAPALASYTGMVTGATIDSTARPGITRPGWIKVDYVEGVVPGVTSREIRFPDYVAAGHTVTIRSSADLLADIMQWYAGSLVAGHAALAPALPAAARMITPTQPRAASRSAQDLYLGP